MNERNRQDEPRGGPFGPGGVSRRAFIQGAAGAGAAAAVAGAAGWLVTGGADEFETEPPKNRSLARRASGSGPQGPRRPPRRPPRVGGPGGGRYRSHRPLPRLRRRRAAGRSRPPDQRNDGSDRASGAHPPLARKLAERDGERLQKRPARLPPPRQ